MVLNQISQFGLSVVVFLEVPVLQRIYGEDTVSSLFGGKHVDGIMFCNVGQFDES